MRVGVLVLQEQPWREARHTWQLLDELGVDTGYVADHLTHEHVAGRWWGDGYTTLAAAAGVTSRLRLGTLVASAAVRSQGNGESLMAFLKAEARRLDCDRLALDTPLDNYLGHRFYYRNGLLARALRFYTAV